MEEHLEYLLAIAEEKNITRAAEKVYISQPALTKYLNKLEEKYGITIFDRTHSPIELTETGRLFLNEKIRIASAEQNLLQKLEEIRNGTMVLKIGIGRSRTSWIIPVIQVMQEAYPKAEFHIVVAGERSLPDMIRSKEINLGIGAMGTLSSDLAGQYLTIEKLRLVIPLKYGVFPEDIDPLTTVDEPYILEPSQLNDLPYIAPTYDLGSFNSFQILMRQYSLRTGRVIVSSSASAIRDLIAAGMGYGYCAIRSSANLCDSLGKPVSGAALLPGLPSERYTSVCYDMHNPKGDLLKEFARLLDENLRKSPNHDIYRKDPAASASEPLSS